MSRRAGRSGVALRVRMSSTRSALIGGRGLKHGLASLALVLAISQVPTVCSAQIVRDGTIGPDAGTQPSGPDYAIGQELGERAGSNLFHSFQYFNVRSNESATFTGDASIQNVFGRVTGNDASTINGLLSLQIPDANLFLINPNGIIFGANAQINVDGVFNASTSEGLQFTDGGRFVTDPLVPPILSHANPVNFGFLGDRAAPIELDGTNLIVTRGVVLDASDVRFNNGAQLATTTDAREGGDIVITASGDVTFSGAQPNSAKPAGLATIAQGDGAGGSIDVRAANVSIGDGGFLLSVTNGAGAGGNISVSADESVVLAGSDVALQPAAINTLAGGAAGGRAGDVRVEATRVAFDDGARVVSRGGGDLTVLASDRVTFSGLSRSGAGASLTAFTGAESDSGDVRIEAPQVALEDGAFFGTSTLGGGDGGSVYIRASESLVLSGHNALSPFAFVAALSDQAATGAGGSIVIEGGDVSLNDGAQLKAETGDISLHATGGVSLSGFAGISNAGSTISTSSTTAGDAGSIDISASTVNLSDSALVMANSYASGKGGAINVTASERVTIDGLQPLPGYIPSAVSAGSTGTGDGGSIALAAPVIELTNGGLVTTTSAGDGAGGDIYLTAGERITLYGVGRGANPSNIASVAGSTKGAGAIVLNAPTIELFDGAFVGSSTSGPGAGGDIDVTARERLTLSDRAFIDSGTLNNGGDAGNITLTVGAGYFLSGATVSSSTKSPGAGGAVDIDADGELVFSGGATLIAATDGPGTGGDITVDANSVSFNTGGRINTSTRGTGDAGSITVSAREKITLSGAGVDTYFASASIAEDSGDAGEISLKAPSVQIADGAYISTLTVGTGAAGNIAIAASDDLKLSGQGTRISASSVGGDEAGNGGEINLTSRDFTLSSGAVISTSSAGDEAAGGISLLSESILIDDGELSSENNGSGDAGRIDVVATNTFRLINGGTLSTQADAGAGGEISVSAGRLVELTNGVVTSSVKGGRGRGGSLDITALNVVIKNGSTVTANAEAGNGGDITIKSERFLKSFDSIIEASSALGISGTVTVESVTEEDTEATQNAQFLDVSNLLRARCSARRTPAGYLSVAGTRGAPAGADGVLPAFDWVAEVAPVDDRLAEATVGTVAFADGATQFRRGDYAAADDRWRAASKHFANAGDARATGDALRGLAQTQQARGQYDEAVQTLERALRIAQGSDDTVRLAAALGGLGNAQVARGEPQSATPLLRKGLALAVAAGEDALAARIANNLGNHYSVVDDPRRALRAYAQSAELAHKAADARVRASALSNAARASLLVGQHARGNALLKQADDVISGLPAEQDKGRLLVQLGLSYARASAEIEPRQHFSMKAAAALQEAISLMEHSADAGLRSQALGELAALYVRDQRMEEALYLTRRALRTAEIANRTDLEVRWHWQEGRVLRGQNRIEDAIESFSRAVSVLEETRQDTLARYGSRARFFRDRVAPVYLDLVDALLEASTVSAGAAKAKLLQARATAERFKAAELRNYLSDDCVAGVEAKTRDLDGVATDAAVVYPILLADRLELLVTLPSGLQRFTVDVDADTVEREANLFRLLLQSRAPRRELDASGQRLYDWLVAPYANLLRSSAIETLVFVPDGALRTIPMAALHDSGGYLIERYSVVVAPGLTLTDPRPLKLENARVLLAGVSRPGGGNEEAFAPLAHVPAELAAIKALHGGEILLDETFTVDRFNAALQNAEPTMVHIASHGQFTGETESSYVLTHDGTLSLTGLVDALAGATFRDEPLDLLMLSACATAAGDERAALGLAGIGVRSGARSAVGSLWSITDEAAATLSTAFYTHLKTPELSRAGAMQHAQLDLLNGAFSHPFYWSAFLLINNWL